MLILFTVLYIGMSVLVPKRTENNIVLGQKKIINIWLDGPLRI